MPDLTGQVGELRLTIDITRADTGEVETYELVGVVTDGEEDGSNPLDSST